MAPNWWDLRYGATLATATAEQAMAAVASDPKIIQAVKDALTAFAASQPGTLGPSRSQVIRTAIADVLQSLSVT